VACPLTPIEEARGRAGPTDGGDYPEKKISPCPPVYAGKGKGERNMWQNYDSISPQGGQSPLSSDHLADLRRSGLEPQDFQQFGIQVRTLTPEELERFLKDVGHGWALPCVQSGYWIGYPHNGYQRVRLFWRDGCPHHGEHPKYLGSPGRPVPAFVPPTVAELAKRRDVRVAVVEGEKKCLALLKHGIRAIGLNFKGQDGGLVEPIDDWDWKDRVVYLIPDGDWRRNPDVVQVWTRFGLELACRGATCYVVTWDPEYGKGIDDAIIAGLNVGEAIQKAKPLASWLAKRAKSFRDAVLSALASVELPADLSEGLIRAIAKSLGTSPKAVRMEVRRRREVKDNTRAGSDTLDPELTSEIRAWLCRPDLIDAILDAVRQVHAGDDDNVVALMLAWASLRFDDPVSVLIQGPPSTGKSHLLETLKSLWPPESYVFRTSLSPKALAYTDESLSHRAIVLAEAVSLVAQDEAAYLIRTLLTEGRVIHETVEKTSKGLRAVKLEQEGPTALFATTTRWRIEDQLKSRVWVIESKSDSNYLNAALDAIAFGDVEVPDADAIRSALAWLYRHGTPNVRIPEWMRKATRSLFPGRRPTELRILKRLLASIRASAFLHQLQRPRDADGAVLATPDDYRVARRALAAAFEAATGDLTKRQREALETVRSLQGTEGAALAEIAKAMDITRQSAHDLLKPLVQRGFLIQDPLTKRYRVAETPKGGINLPEMLPIPDDPDGLESGPSGSAGPRPDGVPDAPNPRQWPYLPGTSGRQGQDSRSMSNPAHNPDDLTAGRKPSVQTSGPRQVPLPDGHPDGPDPTLPNWNPDQRPSGSSGRRRVPGPDAQNPCRGPCQQGASGHQSRGEDEGSVSHLNPMASQRAVGKTDGQGDVLNRPPAESATAKPCYDCYARGIVRPGRIIGYDGRRRCGSCQLAAEGLSEPF